MYLSEVIQFQTVYNTLAEIKLPFKIAYKLNKINEEVQKEAEWYNKEFDAILNEYGMKDEDGHFVRANDGMSIKIQDGRENECQAKIQELARVDVELKSPKLTMDDLSQMDAELTVREVAILMNFIE